MAQQKRTSKFKSSKYEAPKPRRITKQQIANATYKDVKLLEKFISDRENHILMKDASLNAPLMTL